MKVHRIKKRGAPAYFMATVGDYIEVYGDTEGQAKKKAVAALEEYATAPEVLVVCGDGTIIFLGIDRGSWGGWIFRPPSRHTGGFSVSSLSRAVAYAMEIAEAHGGCERVLILRGRTQEVIEEVGPDWQRLADVTVC